LDRVVHARGIDAEVDVRDDVPHCPDARPVDRGR
jgi:hypothetical protein